MLQQHICLSVCLCVGVCVCLSVCVCVVYMPWVLGESGRQGTERGRHSDAAFWRCCSDQHPSSVSPCNYRPHRSLATVSPCSYRPHRSLVLALWTMSDNLHWNWSIRLWNTVFTSLVMDKRTDGRTDGQTGPEHYASSQSRLAETGTASSPMTKSVNIAIIPKMASVDM